MRKRGRQSWRLPIFLAMLCVVLGSLVVEQFRDLASLDSLIEEGTLPRSANMGSQSLSADEQGESYSLTPMAGQSEDDYAEIIERPLFMQSRRPAPVSEVSVDTPQESLSIPEVLIRGIIVSKTRRNAFLKLPTEEKLIQVSEGDDLNGWEISVIEPDKVVIRSGETIAQYFLEDTITGENGHFTPNRNRPPSARTGRRRSGSR